MLHFFFFFFLVAIFFQVQPRLLFVLASDGLLPKSLASTDEKGVLRRATIVSGAVMVVIAAVVPFAALDDLVSAGVLLCFAVTNSCAIVIRRYIYIYTAACIFGSAAVCVRMQQ